MTFGCLRDVLKGPSSYLLGLSITMLLLSFFIIHHILTNICVASAVDLSYLKTFWLSSSSCRCSAHHLKRVVQTRARIRLAMTNITTPLSPFLNIYASLPVFNYSSHLCPLLLSINWTIFTASFFISSPDSFMYVILTWSFPELDSLTFNLLFIWFLNQ